MKKRNVKWSLVVKDILEIIVNVLVEVVIWAAVIGIAFNAIPEFQKVINENNIDASVASALYVIFIITMTLATYRIYDVCRRIDVPKTEKYDSQGATEEC